jgi:hypothetical protein
MTVVYIDTAKTASTQHIAGISMLLQPGTVPESCTRGNPVVGRCTYQTIGAATAVFENVTAGVGHVLSAHFSFTLKSQSLTWSANGLTVEAKLPVIRGFSYHNSVPRAPLPGDTSVTIVYYAPNAGNYDRTGGPAPLSNGAGLGTWWTEQLQTLATPLAVSGSDGSASDTDTRHTLLAGALLGIAGAALIAAVQELVRRKNDLPS